MHIAPDLDSKDIDYLLRIRPSDINLDLLRELFAVVEGSTKPKINYHAKFILTTETLRRYRDKYPEVDETLYRITKVTPEKIETTAGRYLANLFLFAPKSIRSNIDYKNVPLNSDNLFAIDKEISVALREGLVNVDDYMDYINRQQWFGYSLAIQLNPSLDMKIIEVNPKVAKRKKELLELHKKAIDKNNVSTIVEIEKELLDVAKVDLRENNSTGMIIYDSGSGKFGNNYKNTTVMRGAIPVSDSNFSKFNISTSNLCEGIEPEEMDRYADILVMAAFSSAVG